RYQMGASQEERISPVADLRGEGRGVTGFVTGGFPLYFSRVFIKGDNACSVAATKNQQQRFPFDKRGTGNAEESFRGVEFALRIDRPNLLAGGEVEAVQRALGPEGIDTAIGNRRCGTRAFVETEVVAIMGGVIESPDRFAGQCVTVLDHFLVFEPMKH